MKYLLILLFLSAQIFAAGINFEKNLDIAKQKAIKKNKKLMIMYSTPTCPECNYMKKKVFKNEEIIKTVNEKFVSVIMHIRKDKDKLPFEFIGIPTVFFANASDMSLISKKIGGTREAKFLEIVNSVK